MSEPRCTFLIEAAPQADILLRLLAPFAVHSAPVLFLRAEQAPDRVAVRLEIGGGDLALAERLAAKLRAVPHVRSIGLGWRA